VRRNASLVSAVSSSTHVLFGHFLVDLVRLLQRRVEPLAELVEKVVLRCAGGQSRENTTCWRVRRKKTALAARERTRKDIRAFETMD
jgi:hypothetical protein